LLDPCRRAQRARPHKGKHFFMDQAPARLARQTTAAGSRCYLRATEVIPFGRERQCLTALVGVLLCLLLTAAALSAVPFVVRAEQPGEIITTLADGSPEAVLTYEAAEGKTVYMKVPQDWTIDSAHVDLSGEAFLVPQVDQSNEAARYQGTWGVRAQQFRPEVRLLAAVELFLAHTSSRPGDLTVEVREDDGNGYPSATVLTSIAKTVSAGGYRWEEFDFQDVEVETGQPYWIVSYVTALDKMAYPATPSLGDHGYYVGISLRDEYPNGESADFLSFSTGSRWEKFPSRRGWDLMFRTLALQQYLPTGASLDVGDDRDVQWHRPGEFQGTETSADFASELMKYLSGHQGEGDQGGILVPLAVFSNSPGVLRISNIRVTRKTPPPAPKEAATPKPAPSPTASATPAARETPTPVEPDVLVRPGATRVPLEVPAPPVQGASFSIPVLGTFFVALLVLICLVYILLDGFKREERKD